MIASEDKGRLNFIFVLGRPGSGKDTQLRKLLKDNPQATEISPGEIFRRGQNPNDSQFGRFHSVVKPHAESLDSGKYIPAEAISAVISDSVESALKEGSQLFVVNGHPRGRSQLEAIDGYLKSLEGRGYNVGRLYIYLAVSQKEAENRMSQRHGGESLETSVPRADDNPEATKRRLEVFQDETLPMIKELSETCKNPEGKSRFYIVRSDRNAGEVYDKVSAEVKRFLQPSKI